MKSALTPRHIAAGIEECSQTAHDLYLSGVILNHQGMTTVARALLILAVEEYGKIGWLYRGLLLPRGPDGIWIEFWKGFTSHTIKNEIGRMMMTHGDGFLPMLTPFLRDRFPFFSVRPSELERHKQAMLYVDFDAERGEFIAPRMPAPAREMENGVLIEEVEQLMRYVARNREAGAFEPRVLEAYYLLNELALDEPDRFTLLRLFYAAVLRKPTGQVAERPIHEVISDVRRRHPDEADQFGQDWTILGTALHG